MRPGIPDNFADLISRETKAIAHLALVLRDGTPHVSSVWFDYDGQHFLINTARGRVKDRVMRRRPAVALSITDPEDAERCLLIRGKVVAETEGGAYEMMCGLNEKYRGVREFPRIAGQVRVIYSILPDQVFTGD